MLGISSQARFTENVRADFVACLAACLEFYHFISLSYGGQIQSWHLDSKPPFFLYVFVNFTVARAPQK